MTSNRIITRPLESPTSAAASAKRPGDSSATGSTEMQRATANGVRGPTEKATSSPARGRREDGRRIVSRFTPDRIGSTYSPLNQSVFIPQCTAVVRQCQIDTGIPLELVG